MLSLPSQQHRQNRRDRSGGERGQDDDHDWEQPSGHGEQTISPEAHVVSGREIVPPKRENWLEATARTHQGASAMLDTGKYCPELQRHVGE
jgi:hypothetical protein